MNPQDLITQVSDKKKQNSVNNNEDNVQLPTPVSHERGDYNSPRIVTGHENSFLAPWRDDHLLPPPPEHKKNMKCLVLDLDETLVHSSFKHVDEYDFVIPVEIENYVHQVYVAKRPGVDEFMKRCGELYEVVIFTASLSKYADPVLDILDKHKSVDWRLFRESCSPFKGSYIKDMGRMGRDLTKIMIIDNSPHSYAFNPENAIPVESWFSDKNDTELLDMIPILEKLAEASVTDVRETLKEMQISGLEALKLEFQANLEEYSDSDNSEESEQAVYESESDNESGNVKPADSSNESIPNNTDQTS